MQLLSAAFVTTAFSQILPGEEAKPQTESTDATVVRASNESVNDATEIGVPRSISRVCSETAQFVDASPRPTALSSSSAHNCLSDDTNISIASHLWSLPGQADEQHARLN